MRNPDRIPRLLSLLSRYWQAHPDLRLGQIVGNLTPRRHDGDPGWTYYVEDDVLEAALAAEVAKLEEEPRFWTVIEQVGCDGSLWSAWIVDIGGIVERACKTARYRDTRAEAEVDGRASGLPMWRKP